METTKQPTLPAVVAHDLNFISDQLQNEFREMEGRNLLVAGGAGFLGFYLVQSVLAWNESGRAQRPIAITVLDNFVRGVPDWLTARPNLRLLRHDIAAPLPADLGHHDYIVHAASIASPIYYRQRPIETMDANVNGLRFILDRCVQQQRTGAPVRGVLFFSSSEIYGDPPPENIPTPETFRGLVSCTGPRACYDESKRFGETLCVNFARERGVPVKVARPFNNYGPGLKITDRRVIPDFARDIFANRDITMLSDGSAKRTFCYVADAVCGYYKVLMRGQPGEAYNIGVETPEISMAGLADKLVAIGRQRFGYTGRIVRAASADQDYLVDNPNRRCPDIRKARTAIGYTPQVALDDGLERTLAWYSENLTASEA
jgi:nucleoside-diphosphate-sugar epimerase